MGPDVMGVGLLNELHGECLLFCICLDSLFQDAWDAVPNVCKLGPLPGRECTVRWDWLVHVVHEL